MKKILFSTIVALFFVCSSFAQAYNYNIISNGQTVGTLTAVQMLGSANQNASEDAASQALPANQKRIQVTSHFDVHMFITVHVKYDMNCLYEDGKLIESSVMTYKDDDLHSSSKGKKDNGSFATVEDGDESTHKGEIEYSGAMLYFNEPVGISNVFSEIHAIEKPIKLVSKGYYTITDPETGHMNQYFYENNLLVKVMVDHSLFSFTMVLVR